MLLFTLLSLAFAQDCPAHLMRFHAVRPRVTTTTEWDRANRRRGTDTHTFTVAHPFEMQATLATALQWAYVMGGNRPERATEPARRLSCGLIDSFFERLNELSRAGDERLGEFFEGHRRGDVYRLPTEEEWTLVATHALAETMATRGEVALDDVAWTMENSRRKVHDVGEKKPLWLGGLPFYDLFGNLEELTSDHFTDRWSESRAVWSSARVARGGSSKSRGYLADFCTRRHRVYWREDATPYDRYLGFRIVREYPPGDPEHAPFVRR